MRSKPRARARTAQSQEQRARPNGSRAEEPVVAETADTARMAGASARNASPTSGAARETSLVAHAVDASEGAGVSESAARELALRFLERRARTRKELLAHLRERGVPEELSHSITRRFDETGLIDDQGLAERWVEAHRATKSARQLRAELVRRGVDRNVADSATLAVHADVEEAAMLRLIDRRVAAMRALPVEAKQRRLMAVLARRGFASDAARRCVQRALADLGEVTSDDEGPPLSGDPDFLDPV